MSRGVIVVGGGIVGCASAYFCARDGMRVKLLEQHAIGHGASGRNPGFLWLHCRTPGFALDMSRAGRALCPRLRDELPGGFEFRASGGLMYFTTPEQGAVFQEFITARRRDGLKITLIDGAEVRRLVPPVRDDVLGASYCSEDAQIDTPSVLAALARGARHEGATIREHAAVTGLVRDGDRFVGVETDEGRITGDAIVLATGAWTPPLLARCDIEAPIGVERLQILRTAAVPWRIEPLVYGPLAARQYALFRDLPAWDSAAFTCELERDGLTLLPLLVQQSSGALLVGCATDYPPDLEPRPTLSGIALVAGAMRDAYPDLATAAVTSTWAGALPFTTDQRPIIDEVAPGLFVAAGHAFGNTTGLVSAQALSQLIAGRTPAFDISSCRLDRPLDAIEAGTATQW